MIEHTAQRILFFKHFSCVDEKEKLRSIVISGIHTTSDPKATDRAIHDANFVRDILDYPEVECVSQPTSRPGKP